MREAFVLLVDNGSRLEAILTADSARERARAHRDRLVALLAALGVPLWLVACWPGRFSTELKLLSATLWALGALGVVAAVARTWWWHHVRARQVARLGPLPELRRAPPGGAACAPPADEED
jgi:hypothetical protein